MNKIIFSFLVSSSLFGIQANAMDHDDTNEGRNHRTTPSQQVAKEPLSNNTTTTKHIVGSQEQTDPKPSLFESKCMSLPIAFDKLDEKAIKGLVSELCGLSEERSTKVVALAKKILVKDLDDYTKVKFTQLICNQKVNLDHLDELTTYNPGGYETCTGGDEWRLKTGIVKELSKVNPGHIGAVVTHARNLCALRASSEGFSDTVLRTYDRPRIVSALASVSSERMLAVEAEAKKFIMTEGRVAADLFIKALGTVEVERIPSVVKQAKKMYDGYRMYKSKYEGMGYCHVTNAGRVSIIEALGKVSPASMDHVVYQVEKCFHAVEGLRDLGVLIGVMGKLDSTQMKVLAKPIQNLLNLFSSNDVQRYKLGMILGKLAEMPVKKMSFVLKQAAMALKTTRSIVFGMFKEKDVTPI